MKLLLPIIAATCCTSAVAAAPAPSVLNPERVFAAPDLSGPLARGIHVSPDGSVVGFLKPNDVNSTVQDLWIASTNGDAPARRLVDASSLQASLASLSETERGRRERQRLTVGGIVEYDFDSRGTRVLLPVAGELFIATTLDGAIVQRVARGAADGALTDARFSPQGRYISFVRGGTLMVAPSLAGEPTPVSPVSSDAVSYGVAEFVAQEEFARDTGYWWSPREDFIAFTRVDESNVETVQRVEWGVKGTSLATQRYPRAGGSNAVVDLFIRPLQGGEAIQVDLGADHDVYLARVDWSADGRMLYVQRQSRDQQTLELLAIDPTTGKGAVVLTEHQSPWINLSLDFKPLRDGGFLWSSERSGYRHLYLYDRNAKLVRSVTSGAFPVGGHDRQRGIVGVDEKQGLVYVLASPDTPTERQLLRVDYRRGGKLLPVTQGPGWWSVEMASRGDHFVATYSSFDTPPNTAVYSTDGKRGRWLFKNRLDESHPYFPYRANLPAPEFGHLVAEDGQTLHYVLLKPPGFDPSRQYPAIVQVYGGPTRQLVTKAWRDPSERLFLDAGFVVFQLDNRGSANRGLAFEAPIWHRLGTPEVYDQIVGLRFLQSLPYIRPTSIGVIGWSFGGFMTLRLMTESGADFAAGVAGASPADFRRYDTHYTERYLGTPQALPDVYAAVSVLPRLKNLHGRLLLMHGMSDDNVQFENATEIITALQRGGTTFDLMLYPGQRHLVTDPPLQVQQWRTFLEFFRRTLAQGADSRDQ